MKIAKTWTNLGLALTAVPLRIVLLVPLLALVKLGEYAQAAAERVNLIPGFERDWTAEGAGNKPLIRPRPFDEHDPFWYGLSNSEVRDFLDKDRKTY